MKFISNTKKTILNGPYYTNVRYLFEESFETYAIGAYRSAYITSYVGFLQQIRQNLLNSNENPYLSIIPKNKEETLDQYQTRVNKKWGDLIEILKDDDRWEKRLLVALNENKDNNILRLQDQERTDFEFFKNHRNSAVHDKEKKISSELVHALWDFIIEYAPKTRIGMDKKNFLKQFLKIAHWYQSVEIPESRFQTIIESFNLLTETEQVDVMTIFYQESTYPFSEQKQYKDNVSDVFNKLFKANKKKLYKLFSDNPVIGLFGILIVKDIDVTCFTWNQNKSDEVLSSINDFSDRVGNYLLETGMTENLGDFINIFASPYEEDMTLTNDLKKMFFDLIEELLEDEVMSLTELVNLRLENLVYDSLVEKMLDSVEKSYRYTPSKQPRDIDTFAWNNIIHNKYYIIYLANLSLEQKYFQNQKIQEVFQRLSKLFKAYNDFDNPNRDKRFLNNFAELFIILNDFPRLKEKLELDNNFFER